MKLLVDIGNTRSKFALADNLRLRTTFALDHVALSHDALQRHCSDTLRLDSMWISCVGESGILSTISDWAASHCAVKPELVSVTKECCGVRNAYYDHTRLGVDRWVAAIGASKLAAGRDLIIIDAGTAVTVDWLSRNSVFEGGAILPGYDLMHKSLVGNTAGIEAGLLAADRIIGKTTAECVNSGISYGLAGAVDRIVAEMQKNLGADSNVIITGGSAEKLAKQLYVDHVIEPHLVLLGLARIATEVG